MHAGIFRNGRLLMMNQEVRRGKPLPVTLPLKVVVSKGGRDVPGTIDITSSAYCPATLRRGGKVGVKTNERKCPSQDKLDKIDRWIYDIGQVF